MGPDRHQYNFFGEERGTGRVSDSTDASRRETRNALELCNITFITAQRYASPDVASTDKSNRVTRSGLRQPISTVHASPSGTRYWDERAWVAPGSHCRRDGTGLEGSETKLGWLAGTLVRWLRLHCVENPGSCRAPGNNMSRTPYHFVGIKRV